METSKLNPESVNVTNTINPGNNVNNNLKKSNKMETNISNNGGAVVNPLNNQNVNNLIEKVVQVAKNNPDGFTIDLNTFKSIERGFVVAFKDTQNSFNLRGVKKVIRHALLNNQIVGGWYNSNNRRYYFDSVRVFNQKQKRHAIEFGKSNNQIAIFNLQKQIEIKL